MAVFTWKTAVSSTGTFSVVTRSGSYTADSQLNKRSGSYSINNQVSLRSGLVTLYQESSGPPITALNIVFERSILSPIIDTPFNNNFTPFNNRFYGATEYKNTEIYKSINAYVNPSSIVFDNVLIVSEQDFKYTSSASTKLEWEYRFAGSGSLFSSGFSSNVKVTFNPSEDIQLFSITGQHGVNVFKPNWISSGLISITGSATNSNTEIYKSINAYVDPPSIVFDDVLIVSEQDFKYTSSASTKLEWEYRFAASGSLFSSGLYSNLKVTFNPPEDTQLFQISGAYSNLRATSTYLIPSSNLLTFSEQFDNVSWGKSNGFISTNVIVAPDGTTTADAFIENTTPSAYHYFNKTIVKEAASITYTLSTFVQSKGGRRIAVRLQSSGSNGAISIFDLVSETITQAAGIYGTGFSSASSSIIKYPNNWYRIVLTVTSDTATSLQAEYSPLNDASVVYTGDGTSGIYVWGAKLETSKIATPYVSANGVTLYDNNFINTSGSAITRAPNRHIGSSPTNYISSSNIVFGNEENITKVTDGSAKYTFIKGGFSGSGTFTEEPFASQSTAKTALVLINTIILYNTNVITKLAMRYAGKSPTTPFGGLDIVFEELEANAPPQEFKYTGAASVPTATKDFIGSGSIQISGTGVYTSSKAWMGSGSISVGLTASASVSFKAIDGIGLFTFTNGYSDLRATKRPASGAGSISITGAVSQPISISSWVGNSPTAYYDPYQIVFEDGVNFYPTEFKITSTQTEYQFVTPPFQAGGSLFTAGGAAQATGSNPPEDTFLYSISGAYSNLKATKRPAAGAGSIFISGAVSQPISISSWVGNSPTAYYDPSQIIFEDGVNFYPTQYKFTGNYISKRSNIWVSSGSLFTSASGVASVTFNPPEDTYLYSITGTYSNLKASSAWVGSGSITTNASSVARVAFNPLEDNYLYLITGAAVSATTSRPDAGGGSLFTSGFSSNVKIAFNPPEDIQLFQISGAYSNFKFVKSTFSVGYSLTNLDIQGFISANVPSGLGLQIALETVTGSGYGAIVSYFSTNNQISFIEISSGGNGYLQGDVLRLPVGSNPTITLGNPVNAINVRISASAIKSTRNCIIGASPIEYYNPYQIVFEDGVNFYPTEFKITSTQTEYQFVTPPFQAGGSLFTAGGAAEATGSNPPEDTFLYSITGAYSDLKATSRPAAGSGSIFISGAVSPPLSVDFWVGNSPTAYYNPSQIVFEDGVNFYPTQYKFTGTYESTTSEAYIGFGSITINASGVASVTFNPPEDTQLFSISGAYSNFKASSAWVGSGSITTNASGVASVTFNPPEDNYLYLISGAAVSATTSRPDAGGGSLFSSGFSSNVKVTFNPPEDTQLFSITGQHGVNVFKPNWISSGSILITVSATNSTTNTTIGASPVAYYNPYQIVFEDGVDFYPTEFKITSTQTQYQYTKPPFQAGGSLFVAGGAAEVTGSNPPEDTQLFQISGAYSNLKATSRPADGVGSVFISGAVSQPISISSWVGNSPTAYYDPYQIVFEDGVNFYPTQYKFTGTYGLKTSEAYIGSGSITTDVSGVASVTFNPPEDIQLFQISGAYSNLQATNRPAAGSGSLFTSASGVASVTFNPTEDTYLYLITGAAVTATTSIPPSGSGSLFSSGFSSNVKVTFNPPEDNYLYAISGFYSDLKATKSWVGSGNQTITGSSTNSTSITTIGASPVAYYNPYQIVFEDGVDFYPTEFKITSTQTQYQYTKPPFQAGGSLFTAGGAAEATGSNPPEDTQLFSITGAYSNLQAINRPANGAGSVFISGAVSQPISISSWVGVSPTAYYNPSQIVFEDGVNFYPTQYKFTGTYKSTTSEAYIGSGSITTDIFGSASVTFNPTEDTQLFSITGAYTNLQATNRPAAGSGSLFTSASGVASVTFNPTEDTYLYLITGAAVPATTSRPADLRGSLFTSGFSSNVKVTFNPPEDNYLYLITGAYSDLKATSAWVGSGSQTITGSAQYSSSSFWVGSSPIEYYDSYQIVFEDGVDFYPTEFKITSNQSAYKFVTPPFQAGGSLFTAGGAAEATGSNPPEDTQLFSITGQHGVNVFKPNWISSGSISITGLTTNSTTNFNIGASPVAYYNPYQIVFEDGVDFYSTQYKFTGTYGLTSIFKSVDGSGSLFTSASGVASVTFNPPEDIYLYSITGSSNIKATSAWFGSGSITTNASGVASVTFNPPEDNYLYLITGAAVSAKTSISPAGSGSLFSSGFASGVKVTFNPPEDTQLFQISGSAGIKLRDYIWISPIVEFDPYELIINNDFTVTDYIDIRNNIWDSTNNIYRSATTENTTTSNVAVGGSLFTSGFYSNLQVTWNPSEDTTLFNVSGTSENKQSNTIAGFGSITTNASGVASVTFNPTEDTYLYSITGAAVSATTNSNIGSGSITTDVSGSATVTFNPPEDTYLYLITGAATIRVPFNYSGSGSITTNASGVASVTFNPPEDIYLYSVTGAAGSVTTNITIGSGSITTNASGVASVTFNPLEDTYLYLITGAATIRVPFNYSGSGSITTNASGVASVTFNPPEDNYLYSITGAAVSATTSRPADGSGSLFTSGFSSDVKVTFNPPEDTYLYSITGAATSATRNITTGSGFVFISRVISSNFKVTFNPPEDTYLYSITGAYSNLKASNAWVGSGSITSNVSGVASVTFNPPEDIYLYSITGTATIRIPFNYSGSGSIFTSASGVASVTFNPPEDNYLYSITGAYSNLKATSAWVGSGSQTITGSYSNLQATNAYSGAGNITISDSATIRVPFNYSGSGAITTNASGVASVTFNPPEDTYLYSITGAATSATRKITTGSGSLFTSASGVASVTFNPPEDIQLFQISGAYSNLKSTKSWIGSGSITTNASGVASVTFNPPEDNYLYIISGFSNLKASKSWVGSGSQTITGSYSNLKATNAYSGAGNISIAGTATIRVPFNYSGSGSITTNASGVASVTFNPPEDIYLYSITGAATSATRNTITGSGSIFTSASGVATVTFNPPEDNYLFQISGAYSNLKSTKSWIGSGSITTNASGVARVTFNPPEDNYLYIISGFSNLKTSSAWVASGSIATLSGAAERVTWNPVEATTLFSVTGSAASATRNITTGSGSIFTSGFSSDVKVTFNPTEDTYLYSITGSSNLKVSNAWFGSGSITTNASGVASVTFNPTENTQLFQISGAYSNLKSTNILVGSGAIATLSGAAERVTWNPVEATTLFLVTGVVVEKTTEVYVSIPTIVTITGEAETLTISGGYQGRGSLFVAGGASQAFGANPPENTFLYSVTGSATTPRTITTTGSGSLFANGFISDVKVTFNPPKNIFLYSFTGTYSNLKSTSAYAASGLINITAAVSVRTAFRERIFATII